MLTYKTKVSIWVDGDSCPREVKSYLCTYFEQAPLNCIFVSNSDMDLWGNVGFVNCGSGKDAADDYIYEHAACNDIVITRDLIFASRLVDKNIRVINDRGEAFDTLNIADRLNERELSFNFSSIGLTDRGKRIYNAEHLERFKKKFNSVLERALCCS